MAPSHTIDYNVIVTNSKIAQASRLCFPTSSKDTSGTLAAMLWKTLASGMLMLLRCTFTIPR